MTVRIDAVIPVSVSVDSEAHQLDISRPHEVTLGVDSAIRPIDAPHYHGAYSVTPSAEEQTLDVAGLLMEQNVTIAPIPQNYGLITWNGATLTVS